MAVSIKKCPGDKYEVSPGSSEQAEIGRELRTAPIPAINVVNSSWRYVKLPAIRLNKYLNNLTAASQMPPKWGALGGEKCQLIHS